MNNYKFHDLTIGLQEHFSVTVDADKFDKFLQISGDTNPLHIDREYSESKGFADRVVYGMLTSTFYSTLVGVYLPGRFCILHGVDIQFSKPVYIGDELKISGKVSYINEAYKQIEIKAFIANQNKEKVSKATIKVGVMDE